MVVAFITLICIKNADVNFILSATKYLFFYNINTSLVIFLLRRFRTNMMVMYTNELINLTVEVAYHPEEEHVLYIVAESERMNNTTTNENGVTTV